MSARRFALPALAVLAFTLTACQPEPASTSATAAPTAASQSPDPSGSGDASVAPEATSGPVAPSGDTSQACTDAGGVTQARQPTFGTDGDRASWQSIGQPVTLCVFESGSGETASRLYVDPVTISSSTPTLAAIAYLSKTPVPDSSTANPASDLCTALGGARSYGPSAGGGGLVDAADTVEPVVSVCVFADGSFIDEWALAYYSAETVRGIDLTTVFPFDPTEVPSVFSDAAG